jgi:protein tyrosine phosphatase
MACQNTLNFVDDVNRVYNNINLKHPITVHCSAGIGRTGSIIVIDMIIDKIKTHGLQCDIDIYATVCFLRSQRSGMIQTEKQYQFLYAAIKCYIESLNNQIRNPSLQTNSPNSVKKLSSDKAKSTNLLRNH